MKKIFAVSIILCALFLVIHSIQADELDDITNQLNSLKKTLADSQNATKPLESDLSKLQSQLSQIRSQLSLIEKQLAQKEQEVKQGEELLLFQKKLLDTRITAYYKNVKKAQVSLINLIAADNLSNSLQNFFYVRTLADQDKQAIVKIVLYIKNLEEKKAKLQADKDRLALIKVDVDKQSTFLSGEIGKAKKYQAELNSQIAVLSARQQSLLASRLAALNIPQSAYTSQGGCVDDRDKDPGFSPRLAFFTYGVPNRTGLNQYGAKGRAEAGQNTETILKAYYDADYTTGYRTDINIHVVGTNEYGQSFDDTWNIEEYVKHAYEMPSSWHPEALKAQAIAARSYALSYTNNGTGTICPSQSCQVVKKELNSQSWIDAVNATSGVVMTRDGQPIKAWYSSTHGGYVLKSGEIGWSDTAWTKHAQDTSSNAGNFSELQNNAYDKSSPWFYCDWGSRAEYNKTAWLKPTEVADIVNVIMLVKRDSGTAEHLYQTDKANPAGTDTWDADRVKSELRSRGGSPYNSVSDVSVSWDSGAGRTTSVNVNGDAGSNSFDAADFKNYFNIRAPANIQIVGPLFNIEKR